MEFVRRRAEGPSEIRTGTKTFTGTVFGDPILSAEVRIGEVFFAPCSLTYWHHHDGGQILLITKGRGIVCSRDGDARIVEASDVVYTRPGEQHWHGGTTSSFLIHTAITLGTTTWLEEVADAEYRDACARAEDAWSKGQR